MNGNFKTLIAIAATPLLLLSCSDELSSPPRVKVRTLYR